MTTGKGGSRIENGGKCAGNATPYFVAFEAEEADQKNAVPG